MKLYNYKEVNKKAWNRRAALHIKSDFYDMDSFLAGRSSLQDIELALLPDLKGKKVLHLQCHFGQDTLSLARMGATVVGVDISDKAIEMATNLAKKLALNAKFICCDLYDLPNHLEEEFDIVFTSYGTIGWLPDLDRWAHIIQQFLKPDGQFIFAEFHPVVWMFDDDFTHIAYRYFRDDAIVETLTGSYAATNTNEQLDCVTWNHSLSEVVSALLQNGMQISDFQEYDYSPYNCFNKTQEEKKGVYRIQHLDNKIPMTYSLIARKM